MMERKLKCQILVLLFCAMIRRNCSSRPQNINPSDLMYSRPLSKYIGRSFNAAFFIPSADNCSYPRVTAFLGIRYGVKSKDNARFRYQEEYECANDECIHATDYHPACLQLIQNATPTDVNEDCFFLNIFAPQTNESQALFPVLIHIHGGSFQMGSSHGYPALALASTGLVVVTFNYRLGVLGFFPPNAENIPTNIGITDQILVMKWVQRHIDRFYGNPKDVTIMGESAGAASVGIHLVSPKVISKDLFSKAIIISGSDMAPWASLAYSNSKSKTIPAKMANVLKCEQTYPESDDTGVCLRNVSSDDLLDATKKLENEYEREIWTPVIDEGEGILLRKPYPNSPSAKPVSIPLLIGVMDSEASIHATYLLWKWYKFSLLSSLNFTRSMFEKSVLRLLNTYGIPNSQEMLWKITSTYNCSNEHSSCHAQLFEVFSDFFCNAPTYRAALEQTKVNPNVYFFSMTFRSPKEPRAPIYGTYHGTEIPYIFGYSFLDDDFWLTLFNFDSIPLRAQMNDYRNPKDVKMARLLISLWSNFIKTGNPTPDTKALGFLWTPLSKEFRPYLNITDESKMMYNYRQEYMEFWTPDDGLMQGIVIKTLVFVAVSIFLFVAACGGLLYTSRKRQPRHELMTA